MSPLESAAKSNLRSALASSRSGVTSLGTGVIRSGPFLYSVRRLAAVSHFPVVEVPDEIADVIRVVIR